MSMDVYPDWLPSRPPPPGPQSTIQSYDDDYSPVHGRQPAPRSVRIVNLPKLNVSSRNVPTMRPEHQPHLPLPLAHPRFNAKNLRIQLLRNPSILMKLYFYFWPLVVFYHIPLQSFFDFNAVYILLQVTKYPSPGSSSRSWALASTAYIACWFAWILIVILTYEIIYSFARRWRLRRPLILPIYLSAPAFNLAALTSYSTFSFLQHIRLSALSHEHADAIASPPHYSKVHSRSDSQDDVPELPTTTTTTASLSQFLAESAYFYSQNLPTVGLLLPRAALSLALLLSFSTPGTTTKRDTTFFNKQDGTLTDYAKAVLLANAAWTAWRSLVLLVSWIGLWLFSSNRLAGICGPRHIWEEQAQEKTRSIYSSAASEHGVRNSVLHPRPSSYADGYDGYVGDELPWEWREHTRMRVQDAFEFCLASHRSPRSDGLVWGTGRKMRSAKGKERSTVDEKSDAEEGRSKRSGGFEGIEKVLAAIGIGSPSSPSRRGALTRDLFDTPEPDENLVLAGPSVIPPPLKTPKMAKRNSKDKNVVELQNVVLLPPAPLAVAPGAPLLSLPYPFTQNGVGRVASRDGGLVPFPAVESESAGVERSSSSSSTSGSGSGTTGEEDDEDEEEEEEDEDEDDESNPGSESMSSLGQPISPSRGYPGSRGRHGHTRNPSGVSSVGQSISRTQGRRSISSGATGTGTGTGTGSFSGGGYSYRYSYSASSGGGVKSQESETSGGQRRRREGSRSTGNRSTTSEERSISVSGSERGVAGIPMPPRHPNLQVGGSQQGPSGQGPVRTRKVAISAPSSASSSSSSSSGSAAVRLSVPVPAVLHRGSPVVFPSAAGIGSDVEGRYEDQGGFEGYEWAGAADEVEGEGEDEIGERDDRLGLLGVPSPRVSMVSVGAGTIGGGGATPGGGGGGNGAGRSRTHSFHSFISSASSSSRSRTRTHSGSGSGSGLGGSPSVRERASSVGNSVRSLVVAAAAGASSGLGLGLQRSRVNSSMARLEEEEREDAGGAAAGVSVVVGEFGERGYASTASHSRSGSESVSGGENHTFGRPVVFMRGERVPGREERVDEEEGEGEGEGDVVLMERMAGVNPGMSRMMMVERGDGSADEEEGGGRDVPDIVRDDVVPGTEQEQQEQSEEEDDDDDEPQYQLRQGLDIPRFGRDRSRIVRTPTTMVSESNNASHADISTAHGSFVTAPPSFSVEGGSSTGGSETHGMGVGGGEVLGRVGGVGEDGMGGQTWRIV